MSPSQRDFHPDARYIVFEGIDGTGKSTQIRLFADRLKEDGRRVAELMEPTKGSHGKEIRRLLGQKGKGVPVEKWLELFEADRRENMDLFVIPALKRGEVVLQDRSYYSTAAYQGAQGADVQLILQRNRAFAVEPDMVFILDLNPERSLDRVRARQRMETDAFERADYLEKVREYFAQFEGPNIIHLDASAEANEVFSQCWEHARHLFDDSKKPNER